MIDWHSETIDGVPCIESDRDGHIADVKSMEYANLIVLSVHEFISNHGLPSGRNEREPMQSTLLRAIEGSIRRSRQLFSDRTLDGISVFGQYSECLRHKHDECPPLADQIRIGDSVSCYHELRSIKLDLPNGKKYLINIQETNE